MFADGEQENRPVWFGLDHSPQKTALGWQRQWLTFLHIRPSDQCSQVFPPCLRRYRHLLAAAGISDDAPVVVCR